MCVGKLWVSSSPLAVTVIMVVCICIDLNDGLVGQTVKKGLLYRVPIPTVEGGDRAVGMNGAGTTNRGDMAEPCSRFTHGS